MKQALAALKWINDEQAIISYEAVTALRQAIEFEEMVKKGTKAWADTPDDWVDELRGGVEKREWVGLTDEEIYFCTSHIDRNKRGWANDFGHAIEAKLKKKNT
jgi:hypothetical protein